MSTTGLTVPAGYPQEATLIGRELGSLSLLTGGLFVIARGVVGRSLVTAACVLTFVGTGCSPSDPPPPPTPTPSATPTETAQEREQRLAYAAAETSYREFRAEFYRVLRDGGAKSATPKMKATAAGPYLKEATEVVQAYRGEHGHSTGEAKVSSVQGSGYSASELVLKVCDDTTSVETFDRSGKVVGRGEYRTSEITVRSINGTWKIWSGSGKRVQSCDV